MAKHILVVDDSRDAADTKVFVVQKLGGPDFTAEAVYGGRECLERLSRQPGIDLLLLDLEMPAVNGKDVILELLRTSPAPKLKIVIMTAWGLDWITHWEMQDIADTPQFKGLVWHETFDKATDAEELVGILRRASGISSV